MKGSLYDSPLLRIILMVMAGIATGRHIGSLAVYDWMGIGVTAFWGIAVMILLLCGALTRRYDKASSIILLAMGFALGVFLIRNSDDKGYDTAASHYPVIEKAEKWMQGKRTMLSDIYKEEGLTGDDYGIVAAMTLGEKQRVSKDLRNEYNISGAAHIFALSGMHLGIIFMLVALILPFTRYPKTCTFIQITALWTYVLLVGWYASVTRAAVMLTVYAIGKASSRRPDNITILIFTASLLIVIEPQWLFNVGFQMSFAAVFSISICYSRMFKMVFSEARDRKKDKPSGFKAIYRKIMIWIWGVFVLSLTAQMGTAPLVAHYFGRFSCYSLLTNFIVSPAALIIISLALLLLSLATIASTLPWVGIITGCVAKTLAVTVHLLNDAIGIITKLPYASIEDIQLNVVQTVLVYVVIICLWKMLQHLYHMYGQGRKI